MIVQAGSTEASITQSSKRAKTDVPLTTYVILVSNKPKNYSQSCFYFVALSGSFALDIVVCGSVAGTCLCSDTYFLNWICSCNTEISTLGNVANF